MKYLGREDLFDFLFEFAIDFSRTRLFISLAGQWVGRILAKPVRVENWPNPV
jgi:hypothetical protein